MLTECETFLKIEKIVKKQISTFTGLTDLYSSEIITSNANKDGFTHKPDSFKFQLYNGSSVNTITSNYDGARGKRSNCNFYDETGYMIEKAFSATEPYTAQESDFKLGGDISIELEPKAFPNQLIYASSASSVDTYFFKKYKTYSKKMFAGNRNYFVADIDCTIVFDPMIDGEPYKVSLLTKEKVDTAIKENKDKGLREYYNKFTVEGGENQPFKRGQIIKNSQVYRPIMTNEKNKLSHIGIFYDPARSYDNSIVLVVQFYKEDKIGWKARIINCISLVDIGTKKKIPMRTPEQIDYIKQKILDYNGEALDYENMECILIDAGAGGGGVDKADFFMSDFTGLDGKTHRGLIDLIQSKEYINRFPNAVPKLHLISPAKYKTEMFDALVEMINYDLITFTENYEYTGYLMIPVVKDINYKDEKTNEDKKEQEVEYKKVNLTWEEELALKNIDAMKEEIVQICRYDNAERTAHHYALSKEKQNTLHDDRAYVLAMAGWYLSKLRKNEMVSVAEQDSDLSELKLYHKSTIIRRRL